MCRWCSFVVLALALGLSGCLWSFSPGYIDKDLVFEPGLLGHWQHEDGSRWEFEKAGGKSYTLIVSQGDKVGRLQAHLFRLGKHTFLDFFPKQDSLQQLPGLLNLHFVPVHTIWRVEWNEKELVLFAFDYEWLQGQPGAIETIRAGRCQRAPNKGIQIVTASSEKVRSFLSRHASEAFTHRVKFSRVTVPGIK